MHTPDENIVDPTEDEVTEAVTRQEIIEEAQAEAGVEPKDVIKKKLGMGGILKAIATAVKGDNMTSSQARQMRSDLGIMQSHFTRSTVDPKTKRTKRLLAKKARKVNGRAKHKGQSCRKGQ